MLESGMLRLEGTPKLEIETVFMLVGRALLGFSRVMLELNSWVGVLEGVLSELELGVAAGVLGSALEVGVERLTAVTLKAGALETSALEELAG